ncbi:hypothetical protein CIP107550_01610 [Corynebacterium diphtheriae]|nr:hypothetical protein CIP107550_01610 [Corynebacterium diphtheriae]
MAQDIGVLSFVGKGYLNHPSQNQEPNVQPNQNAIGDTICRTTEHGDSYRY